VDILMYIYLTQNL